MIKEANHCKETWCWCFSPLHYESNDLAELAKWDAPAEEFFPRSLGPKRFICLVLLQIWFFPFPLSSALSLAGGAGWALAGRWWAKRQEPVSGVCWASLSQSLLSIRCFFRGYRPTPCCRYTAATHLWTRGSHHYPACNYCVFHLTFVSALLSWRLYWSDFFSTSLVR